MLRQVRAVVLHSIKFGESGIIAQTYSDYGGRQSFLVHGVRKKRSRVSSYLFQPLNVLELVSYIKEKNDLHKVKEVRPAFPLNNLHFDIYRSTIAVFVGEVLYRTLRETETNPHLFTYIEKAVQLLDTTEKGVQNFHLVFLLQLTKFLGIYPGNHSEFKSYHTKKGIKLNQLIDYSLNEISKIKLDGATRKELLDQLLLFYRDHIDGIGQIKSLEVLHEVFHK